MIRRGVIAVIAVLCGAAGAASAGPTYQRFKKTVYENDCHVVGNSHNRPCCAVDGWDWTFDELNHPHCPTLYKVEVEAYSCATDQKLGGNLGLVAANCCSCGPSDLSCAGGLDPSLFIDQAVNRNNYQCDKVTSTGEPEQCDGLTNSLTSTTPPADKGCGADEHKCNLGDADPAPVRYSSGRVESNPITVFGVVTPGDVFFGYRLMYNSQGIRTPAQRNTVGIVHDERPVIHHSTEDTHYVGLGWLDNFSDRLNVTAPNTPATTITWASQTGTVTFLNTGGVWKSWSGTYELIDRGGAPADGFGRWVVRTADPAAPRQIWSFEEFNYTPYDGVGIKTLGRLRRRAVQSSDLTDLVGRFGFTVTWTAEGRLATAIDTFGRQLDFAYHEETECIPSPPDVQPSDPCFRTEIRAARLDTVTYRAGTGATPVVVARLQTTPAPNNDRLERVERPGVAGYTRFLYLQAPPTGSCVHCNALLTDVIVPGDAATFTPALSAPVLATEIVTEHDDYGASPTPNTLVAVHSKAPGREYAYEYTIEQTTQFDLHQDAGPCGAGNTCPTVGTACRTVNQIAPRCYAADVIRHDLNTGLPTSHLSFGTSTPGGGNANAFARRYTANGTPRDVTDAAGNRTTYGYDPRGRLRCIVHNDNDTQAFVDPTQPDTSACAGPATSQIIRVDYTATSITTTAPGALSATVTDVETVDPALLLETSRTTTGVTKDLDGNLRTESHTVTTSYDSLGRVTLVDGPLDNAVAYDAVATSYYTTYDPAWPHDLGQLRSTTRYVGTVSANLPLTTMYAEYDLFGVPHRLTAPDGSHVIYSASPDRLTWVATAVGSDGTTIGLSTVVLNANGTVRSEQDPSSVCVTYEYADATGYVGAPTVIRRSNTGCGVVPIDRASGEVELRTYVSGETDRLQSVTRQLNGVVEMTYAGFLYDRDRRLIGSTTLDSASPFTFSFTQILPSGIASPGGIAAGGWKTEFAADPLGRPASLSRFITATSKQTATFTYPSTLAQRPTTMARGINGGATAVTTFVYDDFGRLLETSVPEVGHPTRYEYDIGSRLARRRAGIGTAEVTTSVYAFDSLDRLTSIDHDAEHPVDCAVAAAGTAIQDEEYVYDSCAAGDAPAGFACSNALGRLAISRAIVQCGSAHEIVKRGRWYGYDRAGHPARIAHATVSGSTVGAAAVVTYAFDAADRVTSYSSPLGDAFGTRYTYGATDGRIASVSTTAGAPIASDLGYRAFGSLASYRTASTQAVDGEVRTLEVVNHYRTDNGIDTMVRRFAGPTTSLDLMSQSFGYTPAGMLGERADAADPASSRHYGYDTLQRLVCEVENGTGADCAIGAARLASLFTYGDGQDATHPPDTRASAYINRPNLGYASAASESYAYTGGAGQLKSVARSDGAITLVHDGLGRRTADYQGLAGSNQATNSRRDYGYLPNGQLGTIQGRTPAGAPYAVAIRYDAEGRPATISSSAGEQYELFWDDGDRLLAVSIIGTQAVRWHYHYFGSSLVAATRELPATGEVKRFWAVSDERGLIARLVDEVGATYWQARWDATAWRQLIGVPQPAMWVPFGMAGQVILDGTEAAPGPGGTSLRPAIVLNQLRAYDPLFGAFLQPDASDQAGRLLPEGYLYGRGDYVERVDATGADSRDRANAAKKVPVATRSFDDSCINKSKAVYDILRDQEMYNQIATDIDKCKNGSCGEPKVGPNIKREWKAALLSGKYFCAYTTHQKDVDPGKGAVDWHGSRWEVYGPGSDANGGDKWVGMPRGVRDADLEVLDDAWARTITPGDLDSRQTLVGTQPKLGCWARMVAHEALHGVIDSLPIEQAQTVVPPKLRGYTWGSGLKGFGHSVIMGPDGLEECIRCNKTK